MAKKLVRSQDLAANSQDIGMDPLYMSTDDSALEIGLTNTYQMYENFTIMLDAAYLAT